MDQPPPYLGLSFSLVAIRTILSRARLLGKKQSRTKRAHSPNNSLDDDADADADANDGK